MTFNSCNNRSLKSVTHKQTDILLFLHQYNDNEERAAGILKGTNSGKKGTKCKKYAQK